VIDLSGRVVIVTGGNSGIARGVARAGVSVAIWSRREERNAEAVAELEELGATAIGVQCDVSDEDNVACASERRSAGSIAWSPTPRRPANSRSRT
jgi:NAD(P)-dependent dehydrogenase (short-subunit alcohol dehydrogenase family)